MTVAEEETDSNFLNSMEGNGQPNSNELFRKIKRQRIHNELETIINRLKLSEDPEIRYKLKQRMILQKNHLLEIIMEESTIAAESNKNEIFQQLSLEIENVNSRVSRVLEKSSENQSQNQASSSPHDREMITELTKSISALHSHTPSTSSGTKLIKPIEIPGWEGKNFVHRFHNHV